MRAAWHGWFGAAWLLAVGSALGQAPPRESPLYVLPNTYIQVPFTVNSPRPAEVQVYISWDRGQNWSKYLPPLPSDAKHFDFRPKQDGEFWFATRVIDRNSPARNAPPTAPQCRIVIDTQKPALEVNAEVDSQGQVALSWTARDPNLNPGSLIVEYQDAAGLGGPWHAVQFDPTKSATAPGTLSGRMAFAPVMPSKQINLRAEVVDAAGNKNFYSKQLSLAKPQVEEAAGNRPAPELAARSWPAENQLAVNPSPGVSETVATPSEEQLPIASDAAAPADAAPQTVRNPYARQDQFAGLEAQRARTEELPPPQEAPSRAEAPSRTFASIPPPRSTPDYSPLPPQQSPLPPQEDITPLPQSSSDTLPRADLPRADLPRSESPGQMEELYAPAPRQPIETPSPSYAPPSYTPPAYSRSQPTLPDLNGPAESVAPPTGERPRLTSARRFSLEYDVESVGPEGVSDVELWGTSDGGRTWAKWGADPDRVSPFDVEVASEAQYGFRVVIIGRNGLAGNAPQAGDSADIWVGVDLTKPIARMTQAAYGAGENAGKLDIRWEASDANLSSRPITLSFSDRPDGQYSIIAAGLPNSGQYLWEFDPRSPRQIYLRLEARDDAGNITIDQLREPINVEGLTPKGRIRDIAPNSDLPRGAFRSPLFR